MNIYIVPCQHLAELTVKLLLIHIEVCAVLSYDYIRENQRKEIDVVAAHIQQPSYIIQRCD